MHILIVLYCSPKEALHNLHWLQSTHREHHTNVQHPAEWIANHLFLAALAFLEVHPTLLSLLSLGIQLCKSLLTLPPFLELFLLVFALVIILVCDLHKLHEAHK